MLLPDDSPHSQRILYNHCDSHPVNDFFFTFSLFLTLLFIRSFSFKLFHHFLCFNSWFWDAFSVLIEINFSRDATILWSFSVGHLVFLFHFCAVIRNDFSYVTFATLHLSFLPRIFLHFSLYFTIMLASSHFSSSSETYVALFFLPPSLHPSCLATLPVDLRIRTSQWCHREVELQWREENEAGVEVTRRCISLSAPPMDVLVGHLCDFTEAVSNSPGIMPRLRISTVSI